MVFDAPHLWFFIAALAACLLLDDTVSPLGAGVLTAGAYFVVFGF